MEGVPQAVESNEAAPEWRELKAEASEHADRMLAEYDFENKTPDEQIEIIDALLPGLESHNENRFVYRTLSLYREHAVLTREHASQIASIESSLAR